MRSIRTTAPRDAASEVRKTRSSSRFGKTSNVDKRQIRNGYLFTIGAIGTAVMALCAYHLPIAQLDAKFVALTLIAILIGSRITIKIPGARGEISVSDTFTFLAILLFGI